MDNRVWFSGNVTLRQKSVCFIRKAIMTGCISMSRSLSPEYGLPIMITGKRWRYAQAKTIPPMLDFSGINCVNSRKREGEVWSDPKVILQRYRKALTRDSNLFILHLKTAELINNKLHGVTCDITGQTGLTVFDVVIQCERDPVSFCCR